jgi:hypothetical protein
MIKRRRRVKQTVSLRDRVADYAKSLRDKASSMPPCETREDLLKRAHKADVAVQLEAWISSPGLRPPTR